MHKNELWSSLFELNKEELRKRLEEHGVTRTKSLTKYKMIVKLYGILLESEV